VFIISNLAVGLHVLNSSSRRVRRIRCNVSYNESKRPELKQRKKLNH